MRQEIKDRIEMIRRGKVPEGYKKTENEVFPETWIIKKIGELIIEGIIFKPMDGNHGELHPKNSDYVEKGIPFIMASDIENDRINLKACKFIKKTQSDRLQKGFVFEGDVLLTHKGSVGNTVIVPKITEPYIMLTPQVTYYRIKDQSKLNNKYLKLYFQSEPFQKRLKVLSKGGTRDYIGIVAQTNMKILYPSNIKEQQKIASILSTWDRAIELKEQLLEEKKKFKKGLMQNLLAGKKKSLQGHIKEISIRNTNNAITKILSVNNVNGFIEQHEQFSKRVASKDTSNYKVVEKGQFAYNPSRVNVGSIDLLQKYDKGILSPMYVVFETDERYLDAKYLYQYLKSDNFYKQMKNYLQGSVRSGLSFKALESMKMFIPDLYEQQAIERVLSSFDNECRLLQKELDLLKEQKKGLMQLFLTGIVRVNTTGEGGENSEEQCV